jgi:RNA recognition motif-containing protein
MSNPTPKRLFVGGLSWETDEATLRAAFERIGAVIEATVVCDPFSGRPRGFGFITYAERGRSAEAIATLGWSILDGSTIRVSDADETRDPSEVV